MNLVERKRGRHTTTICAVATQFFLSTYKSYLLFYRSMVNRMVRISHKTRASTRISILICIPFTLPFPVANHYGKCLPQSIIHQQL